MCPACHLVSRTPVALLGTPAVTCGHCGHTRPLGSLAAHLPDVSMLPTRRGLVRRSEFPTTKR